MSGIKNEIIIGLMFISGIFVFISGQFIISTVLFATSAIYSNIIMSRRLHAQKNNEYR